MLLRQNRILIDLGAIRHNYRVLADSLPKGVGVMPVVKANAYGHGMVEVSRAVLAEGAACLAVALVEEGIQLRESGVDAEILVFGAAMERGFDAAIRYDITQTVFDPHTLRLLDEAARAVGKKAKVHIKLDTGMGRIGLRTDAQAQALARALGEAPHVQATGIYTHFADADNPPPQGGMNDFTRQQWQRFLELKAFFDPAIPAHAANSAASLLGSEAYFHMVREGIALYGYPPVKTSLAFRHALRWEAEVVQVKDIEKDAAVGYGCTFIAPAPMRIATVAVGYGDGYHRMISNRGHMLVEGKRAKVIGRVCMDQTMIDVTEIPGVKVGAQVVLIGRQGREEISAEELADWAGTISYEMLLAVTSRVPRVYMGG